MAQFQSSEQKNAAARAVRAAMPKSGGGGGGLVPVSGLSYLQDVPVPIQVYLEKV